MKSKIQEYLRLPYKYENIVDAARHARKIEKENRNSYNKKKAVSQSKKEKEYTLKPKVQKIDVKKSKYRDLYRRKSLHS